MESLKRWTRLPMCGSLCLSSFQDLAEFRDAIESLEAEPAEGDSP